MLRFVFEGKACRGSLKALGGAAALWGLFVVGSVSEAQIPVTDFITNSNLSSYPGWVTEQSNAVGISADMDPIQGMGVLSIAGTNPPCLVSRVVLGAENGPWQAGTASVAFIEFWLRPVAVAGTNAPTSVDIDGGKIGFAVDGSLGRAFAYDGDGLGGGGVEPLAYGFPIEPGGVASNWMHVAIRRDYSNSWYDVWIDGTLYAVGAGADISPPPSAPSLFAFDGDVGATVRLDLLGLSVENPLFDDADRDGMPDAFEESRGLNPTADDRDGDIDGDGAENMGEYAMGTAPDDAGSVPSSSNVLFYVDGVLGDDGFNGLASHPSAAGGPKRTIDGGMGLAGTSGVASSVVVIRGSTNAYLEQSVAPGTNAVVLRPIGNVKIQP